MEIAGQDAELPEIRRRSRYFALFGAGRLPGDRGAALLPSGHPGGRVLPGHLGQHRPHRSPAGGARSDPRSQGEGAGHRAPLVQRVRDAEAADGRGVRAPARRPGDERRRGDRRLGAGAERAGPRVGPRAERPVLLAEDISREAMAAIETGRRPAGREDRLGAAPVLPDGGAGRARARLHERDLRRRAARQEGRGVSRRRSHRPHRDRAAVGRLPARAGGLPEDRRRPARDAQDRHPRRDRRAGRRRRRWPATTWC